MDMNEAEISAKLTTTEPEETVTTPSEPSGVPDDVGYTRLYDTFNIQNPDVKTQERVKAIYTYAKSITDGEYHNVLWAIRDMGHKLGAPRLGEARLTQLWGYVTLLKNRQHLDKEIQSLER